jgi:DNA-binding NarL/FixJ family response regulator
LQLLTIAIYSTSCETEDIHNCFVLGANVYIKKPNDFEILKKNLQKVISVNWQYQISDLSRETFFLTL